MASITRLVHALRFSSSRTRSLVTKTPAILSAADLIEEQTLPGYSPEEYYPVQLGETFNGRYLVICKLGYGVSSTVWLARDTHAWWWQANPFVTLKILTKSLTEKAATNNELQISQHIASANPKHEGLRYLRTVMSSFETSGSNPQHLGLVYAPMRESLARFQRRSPDGRIPDYLLKPLLAMILAGLDYLHTDCHIIHTDLKPDNILLGIESHAAIEELFNAEAEEPTPRKIEGSRQFYPSRNFGDLRGPPGPPKIADFGLAVRGDVTPLHNHFIQPDLFQAPEVILGAGWSYSADIWNLGAMLWDLAENRTLFHGFDHVKKAYSPRVHLLEMISLLGPPPAELLARGERTSQYFPMEDENETSKHAETLTFDNSLPSMTGEGGKPFLSFVSRMLQWMPEKRATAKDLLKDPWLTS